MEVVCPITPVDEDTDCKSNLHSVISSKETNAEAQQYTRTNMEDIVENDVQGDCHSRSVNMKDSLIDGKVGVLDDIGVHYLQVSHGEFHRLDETYLQVEVANSVETSICQDSILPVPCEAKLEKCLSKSASFPSSEFEFSHPFCMEENVPSPSTTSSSQGASLDQLPTYKRSVSLPAPLKLVSAMKGGRAQNGTALKLGLNVKWALDVYDPPESSMSPMMPSNGHRRPKLKKKDKNKQKQAKGKSVRGSTSEKKHANKRHAGGLS